MMLPSPAKPRPSTQLNRVIELAGSYQRHPVSIRTEDDASRNVMVRLRRSLATFFS